MPRRFSIVLLLGSFLCLPLRSEETPPISETPAAAEQERKNTVRFHPPNGWRAAEAADLPPRVKVMVVGKGPSAFPPSMNLSLEPYKGTLAQYLKIVKKMNSAQGYEWKDLGQIRTESGYASLSQVDTKTSWGEVRLMHVILVKNGYAYILTASALRNEFNLFYKVFFASMRSLNVGKETNTHGGS